MSDACATPEVQREHVFNKDKACVILSQRVQTNLLQRVPHRHRRRRCFGVTLVVWNEDAWEECFQSGAAFA